MEGQRWRRVFPVFDYRIGDFHSVDSADLNYVLIADIFNLCRKSYRIDVIRLKLPFSVSFFSSANKISVSDFKSSDLPAKKSFLK